SFNPLLPPRSRNQIEPGAVHIDGLSASAPVPLYFSRDDVAGADDQALFLTSTSDRMPFPPGGVPNMTHGPAGSWDDGQVARMTGIRSEVQVLVWFAGRSHANETWRIGLARSSDGGAALVEDPHNPVLREGGADDFDELGATDPEVLYDPSRHMYRLWYTGLT